MDLLTFNQSVATGNQGLSVFLNELSQLAERHNVYMLATSVGDKNAMEVGYIGDKSPSKAFVFHTSKGKISKAFMEYQETGFDKDPEPSAIEKAEANAQEALQAFEGKACKSATV